MIGEFIYAKYSCKQASIAKDMNKCCKILKEWNFQIFQFFSQFLHISACSLSLTLVFWQNQFPQCIWRFAWAAETSTQKEREKQYIRKWTSILHGVIIFTLWVSCHTTHSQISDTYQDHRANSVKSEKNIWINFEFSDSKLWPKMTCKMENLSSFSEFKSSFRLTQCYSIALW